jgi:hypothetical protein
MDLIEKIVRLALAAVAIGYLAFWGWNGDRIVIVITALLLFMSLIDHTFRRP